MNTILYFPESPAAKKELARQAAFLHAQAILEILDSLCLSSEQKVLLIRALEKAEL